MARSWSAWARVRWVTELVDGHDAPVGKGEDVEQDQVAERNEHEQGEPGREAGLLADAPGGHEDDGDAEDDDEGKDGEKGAENVSGGGVRRIHERLHLGERDGATVRQKPTGRKGELRRDMDGDQADEGSSGLRSSCGLNSESFICLTSTTAAFARSSMMGSGEHQCHRRSRRGKGRSRLTPLSIRVIKARLCIFALAEITRDQVLLHASKVDRSIVSSD